MLIALSLLAGLSIIYQTQFDEIITEKHGIEEELEQEKAIVGELENKSSAQQEEISILENRTQELEERAEDAEASSAQSESAFESLENQVSSLETELEDVRDEKDTLNIQMTNICADDQKSQTAEEECSQWE